MGRQLYFGRKEYIYLQPREERLLDAIVAVLKEAPNSKLGMTELIKTVMEVVGPIKKDNGKIGRLFPNTISRGIWILNGVRNTTFEKNGETIRVQKVLKVYEIKRKRYVTLMPAFRNKPGQPQNFLQSPNGNI